MTNESGLRLARRVRLARTAYGIALGATFAALVGTAPLAEANAEIESFMQGYLDTFDHGHARDIVAHYDAPLLMLAPNGDLRTYETPKNIRLTIKKWKRYMIHSGFEDSRWVTLNVKKLTEGTAVASTAFERLNTSGQVYQRGGATYTLRKKNGHWVITLIHIHDSSVVMSLD